MSLSSADYSKLPELVDMLMEEFKDKQVSVSLPSLRIDSFSIDIAKLDAYDIGCELQKKRIECAIMIKAALADEEENQ